LFSNIQALLETPYLKITIQAVTQHLPGRCVPEHAARCASELVFAAVLLAY